MKRNLLLVVLAVLVVSLIISVNSLWAARKDATPARGGKGVLGEPALQKMHEACAKNPEMAKYMEKHVGKDWKKHHEEMKKNMKDMKNCPMMSGENGGMMGGKGGGMMKGKGMMSGGSMM